MLWYLMMIATGLTAVWLLFSSSDREMEKRQAHYAKLLHSAFVICDTGQEADLYRSYYVIGRRRRRCDLSLDFLKDPAISKVHGILWYDNALGQFSIAPARNWTPARGVYYPEITVNAEKVPPTGVLLNYGDDIRMGSSQFTLALRKGG